jgi:chitinase
VAPALPGRIEAENYDKGGEGVGYYNTTVGNPGGAYRSDDVGIEPTSDTGGGYDVGWLNTGEWLEYTVNPMDRSAIYSISVRVAAASSGGQLRVQLNGIVLGTITITNTGGYQNWQTFVLPNVPIKGGIGSQALRLEVLNGGFNINWIQLDRVQICGTNNIALNQPISASSVENSSLPVTNAVDGDPATRWGSAFSDPQWITVDLGSVQNIARVRLIWENAYSPGYSIQLSTNNTTWTSVYTTTNGPGSINDLATLGSGRYVRMYGTIRATSYGYSLWEFEVYPTLVVPALAIGLSGTNVVISWPSSSTTGWSLEAAPALGLPSNWSTLTTVPSLLNSEYIVTNAISSAAQFYRLAQNF